MITKIIFIFVFILIQNIFLVNPILFAEEYIEVDKIVAIVETRTITKLELGKQKQKIRKAYTQKGISLPSDKKITELSVDQLITEKLVLEYGLNQGIFIDDERLNNVIMNIAKSNNLSNEELIREIEGDGTSFSDFREDIRTQLIFDQVKKRLITASIKISEFEIDNFIELQKERTPTKYNYSHIFIEYIKDDSDSVNVEVTIN